MKTCIECGIEKELDEFSIRSGATYRHNKCKACFTEYRKKRYRENPEIADMNRVIKLQRRQALYQWLEDYLSTHPCVDCGTTDIRVLTFDHVYEKNFDIPRALRDGMKVARLEKEVANCEVRCSNCHTIVTAERKDNWRWRAWLKTQKDSHDIV